MNQKNEFLTESTEHQLNEARKIFYQWWLENQSEYSDLEFQQERWGFRWMRKNDVGKSHLVPIVELRPMKDERWVALCLKYSTARYSRNVYSYGGLFVRPGTDELQRLHEVLRYLREGFAPSKRPVLVRKTLKIDLRDLHEAGQEGYRL